MAKSRFKTKLSKAQKRRNWFVLFIVYASAYAFLLLFLWLIGILDNTSYISTLEFFALTAALLIPVLSMLLFPALIAAMVLGAQKGKAKRVRDDSTFVPVRDIEYYRDILSDLTPSLVSLLVDLDIYGKKDIVATLLKMQNKKIIAFQENGSIIVTDEKPLNLNNDELQLLYIVKNGKLNDKKILSQWKQNCFRAAEQLGYIKKNEKFDKSTIEKNILKYILSALVCLVCAFILWGTFLHFDVFKFETIVEMIQCFLFLLIIDLLIFVPWYLLAKKAFYNKRGDVVWERTPLGNETAEKIAGLQRFIHEFSLLSEAKKEQVVLWDDYLVYAIVLEENEQIVKDISKRYKINLRNL